MQPTHAAAAAALLFSALAAGPVLAQTAAPTQDRAARGVPAATGSTASPAPRPDQAGPTAAGPAAPDPGMTTTAGSPGSQSMPGSAGQNTVSERR